MYGATFKVQPKAGQAFAEVDGEASRAFFRTCELVGGKAARAQHVRQRASNAGLAEGGV